MSDNEDSMFYGSYGKDGIVIRDINRPVFVGTQVVKTIQNKDQKLLKKSNIGYLNRELNGYFCYKWTINNIFQFIKPLQAVHLLSPEFKIGTNNENAFFLRLIIKNGFETSVQLYLISCKDSFHCYVHLYLLNRENRKTTFVQKPVEIPSCRKGKVVEEFTQFMHERDYYENKIPIKNLTILCEIIVSSPKSMKITKNSKSDDLKVFLSKEELLNLSDVTVSIGESKFHLHKAILASRSAIFLAMFQHDTKENKENLVEIIDVDENIMKKIILYIYTDEIENLEEDVCDIFVAADKYGMEGLKLTCIEELSNSLTFDNVFQILVLADTYNTKLLEMNALTYIASNLIELIEHSGYKVLRNKYPHLIEKILLAVAEKLKNS